MKHSVPIPERLNRQRSVKSKIHFHLFSNWLDLIKIDKGLIWNRNDKMSQMLNFQATGFLVWCMRFLPELFVWGTLASIMTMNCWKKIAWWEKSAKIIFCSFLTNANCLECLPWRLMRLFIEKRSISVKHFC